jgi:hypothetical protein
LPLAKADDALQQKIFGSTISPKKVVERGGRSKTFFPDIQKRGEKVFPDINQLN